jgi:hypothetical protein
MDAIEGTIKNGQIVTSEPMNWLDGTRVRIELIPAVPGGVVAIILPLFLQPRAASRYLPMRPGVSLRRWP